MRTFIFSPIGLGGTGDQGWIAVSREVSDISTFSAGANFEPLPRGSATSFHGKEDEKDALTSWIVLPPDPTIRLHQALELPLREVKSNINNTFPNWILPFIMDGTDFLFQGVMEELPEEMDLGALNKFSSADFFTPGSEQPTATGTFFQPGELKADGIEQLNEHLK